jgi:hypothetical protein
LRINHDYTKLPQAVATRRQRLRTIENRPRSSMLGCAKRQRF